MSVSIQVLNGNSVVNRIENMNEVIQNQVKREIIKSGLKVETSAKRKAPSDTGRLRSSINNQIINNGFTTIVRADVDYAMVVEKGSRPHFPPPSALEGWARRHNAEGLEFAIALMIARFGTRPRPFLIPSWENEKPIFINNLKRVIRNSVNN